MVRIEMAQKIIDDYTNYGKKVIDVFVGSSPVRACIVFEDHTCTIVSGKFAYDLRNRRF